jgi:hypothetical protein
VKDVVFHDRIFEWINTLPANVKKFICSACRRIEDKYEDGIKYLLIYKNIKKKSLIKSKT